MDPAPSLIPENPKQGANLFSKLFFNWISKPCYKSFTGEFQIGDLFKLEKSLESQNLGDILEKHWQSEFSQSERLQKTPSLAKVLFKTVYKDFLLIGLLLFLDVVGIRIAISIVLSYFLNCLWTTGDDNHIETHVWALSLILLTTSSAMICQHYIVQSSLMNLKIKIGITTLIYRKVLKTKINGLREANHLLSQEVSELENIHFANLHVLWILPIQILIASYLLWQEFGIVLLFVILPIPIVLIPVIIYLSKYVMNLRLKANNHTKHRMNIVNEIIEGIKLIKMFVLEKTFLDIIQSARDKEINVLKKLSSIKILLSVNMYTLTERTLLFLTISAYLHMNNGISPEKLFPSVLLIDNLLYTASGIFGNLFTNWAESLVAIKKFQTFLTNEKCRQENIKCINDKYVLLKNVDVVNAKLNNLKNMNLCVDSGKLCVVIGPPGSGKSAFLQLLLGELCVSMGKIYISSNVSYVSQIPWIFSSSLQNNIIFGQEFNIVTYKQVVEACDLEKEFSVLPEGDQTSLEQDKAILSENFRARINLARALYKSSDVYLMDNIFQYFENPEERGYIFQECYLKFLNKKTRIVVTSDLEFVKKADLIVILKNGKVQVKNSFHDMSQQDIEFVNLFLNSKSEIFFRPKNSLSKNITNFRKNRTQTVVGSGSVFWIYIKNIGVPLCAVLLGTQTIYTFTDYWMYLCTQLHSTNIINNNSKVLPFNSFNETFLLKNETELKDVWIAIYSLLSLASIFLIAFETLFFIKLAMNASTKVYNKAFSRVIESPLKFFESNKSSKIVEELSKNMNTVDWKMHFNFLFAILVLSSCFGNIVIILICNYYNAIPVIFSSFVMIKITCWLLVVSKKIHDIKMFVGAGIQSYTNLTTEGLTNIRAFKKEEILIKQFEDHLNTQASACVLLLYSNAFFLLWIRFICSFLVCVLTFSSIYFRSNYLFDKKAIGFSLSQSLTLFHFLPLGISFLSDFLCDLPKQHEIARYMKLETENSLEGEKLKFRKYDWPNHGAIQFKNVSTKRVDQSKILKSVNFEINPGDKIGIVGKIEETQSLISALFRLHTFDGNVIIDGINTKNVVFEALRRKISVIPGKPMLFSRTLRFNLDPFGEFDDIAIWNALKIVKLKQSIKSLNILITDDRQFNLVQKKLIYLAKAVLNNNKILIFDDTDVNCFLDKGIESFIDSIIKSKLGCCTVLKISHSLDYVMECERILVMNCGRILEIHKHKHRTNLYQ